MTDKSEMILTEVIEVPRAHQPSDDSIKRWRADALDFKHEYWDRIVALCDTVIALRAAKDRK